MIVIVAAALYLFVSVCFFGRPIVAATDSMLDAAFYFYIASVSTAYVLNIAVFIATLLNRSSSGSDRNREDNENVERLLTLIRLSFLFPIWTAALWVACVSFDQSGIVDPEKFWVSVALIGAVVLFCVGLNVRVKKNG